MTEADSHMPRMHRTVRVSPAEAALMLNSDPNLRLHGPNLYKSALEIGVFAERLVAVVQTDEDRLINDWEINKWWKVATGELEAHVFTGPNPDRRHVSTVFTKAYREVDDLDMLAIRNLAEQQGVESMYASEETVGIGRVEAERKVVDLIMGQA